MTTLISTDGDFTIEQRRRLRLLIDLMIPAVDDMPGATDDAIYPDIERRLVSQKDLISEALLDFDPETEAEIIITSLKTHQPAFVQILQSHVVAVYYQDDRVLRALGLPDRAPYPDGHKVEETDWTLLDPVRQRSSFYRVVDA